MTILGSTVGGNYTCNNCEQAHLETSTINGNVQISGENEYSVIENSTIKGNLAIKSSRTDIVLFFIDANEIGGNLSFNNNEGLAFITDNAIDGKSHVREQRACAFQRGQYRQEHEGAVRGVIDIVSMPCLASSRPFAKL